MFHDYKMTFDVDYNYRGAQTQPQHIGDGGIYRAPAYFLVNSFLTFAAPKQHWSVSVYGQTLFVSDRKLRNCIIWLQMIADRNCMRASVHLRIIRYSLTL